LKLEENNAEPFPWPEMMAAGLGVLQLSSAEFWAMTPRELNAAFRRSASRAAPTRNDLARLMQAFPDGEQEMQCPTILNSSSR
jgi:uncharacterized phage protein (TIGR02216 family)